MAKMSKMAKMTKMTKMTKIREITFLAQLVKKSCIDKIDFLLKKYQKN